MFTTLNVSHLTTQGIKKYLSKKGYSVSVENNTRFNRNSVPTFSIKFIGSEKVTEEIMARIRAKSETYSEYCSATRLLLNDELIIEILPLLPDLKTSENPLIVNTQKASQVNTNLYYKDGLIEAFRRSKTQAIKENVLAEEILNSSDFESKVLNAEERRILENYAGKGAQYEEGNQSQNVDALTQFYTPEFVGEFLYKIAANLGFPKDGKVLEPSCGVGRLIKHAPDYSNVTAFEISDTPYRIAKKLYPQATIYKQYFETTFLKAPRFTDVIRGTSPTWLEAYPFDLIIGNPPYGKHKNIYQSFFGNPKFAQIEFFFMYYAAKLLKPGGLMMYVTSANFLRTGSSYQANKEKILSLCDLVDSYRMPNEFMELTEVGTDILIFRRD